MTEDESAGPPPPLPQLHLAAFSGHASVVRNLLKGGADPNAKDNEHGFTPLHFAAAAGQPRPVKVLLEAGADPNAASEIGGTPLHMAASCLQLLEQGADHASVAGLLLSAGADPDAKDNEGSTPLHASAGVFGQTWTPPETLPFCAGL